MGQAPYLSLHGDDGQPLLQALTQTCPAGPCLYQLYVTILTDLTDPERPEVLAVAEGRDEAAGRECLGRLSEEQRRQVRAYRADMAPAFHAACRGLLPNARAVIDRFHVAKKFNEAVDRERGKNHPGLQGEAVESRAEGVPVPDVGVPPRPAGPV